MNQMDNKTKQDLDIVARAQQMKINARLTALQCAQTLMSTPGFANKYEGGKEPTGSNAVDHITLMSMAIDIESYILGDIEEETKKALDEAAKRMNSPRILRPA